MEYFTTEPMTEYQVLEAASCILANRFANGGAFTSPRATGDFIRTKLAHLEYEVFAVLFLDNQHRLIRYEEMFRGTIDGAAVYPREVVKEALRTNAAAVILAHNHPSGDVTPSQSDRAITKRLVDALSLVDIRVLDHLIVGREVNSLAELGYL